MKTLALLGLSFLCVIPFGVAQEKSGSDEGKWGIENLVQIEPGLAYRSIAVSPNGDVIAFSTQSRDRESFSVEPEKVILITRGGRKELLLSSLDAPRRIPWVDDLVFSQDGKSLYGYRSVFRRVVAWDVASAEKISREFAEGSFAWSFALNPTVEGSGLTLTAGSSSKTNSLSSPRAVIAIEWNNSTGQEIQLRDAYDQPVGSNVPVGQLTEELCFSPDGTILATTGKQGLCLIDWDTQKKDWKVVSIPLSAHSYGVAIAPDSHTVAVGTVNGVFVVDRLNPKRKPIALAGHGAFLTTGKARVNCVDFLKDGTLVSAGGDGNICLWNLQSKKCITTVQLGAPIEELACSRDGYSLYAAGTDGVIRRVYRKGMTTDTFAVALDEDQVQK